MKRLLFYFCLLITLAQCKSQDTKLLSKTLITDFSDFPFFEKVAIKTSAEVVWKERYKHIDSINVSRITYSSDGLKVNGFCVSPKKKGEYPVIIFNRGGSFEFGALTVGLVATWLGELANEGYVVLASQYRGNGGSEGKEEFGGGDINDVLNLIDVADEIEAADSEKIGMYGWSRGGMMTYLALPKTDRLKAAVVGGAVSDFRALEEDRPGFTEYIPNFENNETEELDRRSAVLWADTFPKNVPILILHGNADWRVKPEQSLNMALEFEKHRIPYRLMMFEGGDHGITEFRSEVNKEVISWFDRYLKNNEPLPNMEFHGR